MVDTSTLLLSSPSPEMTDTTAFLPSSNETTPPSEGAEVTDAAASPPSSDQDNLEVFMRLPPPTRLCLSLSIYALSNILYFWLNSSSSASDSTLEIFFHWAIKYLVLLPSIVFWLFVAFRCFRDTVDEQGYQTCTAAVALTGGAFGVCGSVLLAIYTQVFQGQSAWLPKLMVAQLGFLPGAFTMVGLVAWALHERGPCREGQMEQV